MAAGSTATIGPMREDDLPRVMAIDRAVGWPHVRERFQYLLEDENTHGLIAECAGEIVGFAFAGVREPHGWIGALAVDPAYQRQAIGAALLDAADALLRDDPRCDAAVLEAYRDNVPAIALYSRHGFVVTGESVLCGTPRHQPPTPITSHDLSPDLARAVTPLGWDDFDFLDVLDAGYYGGWRDQDLRYWLHEGPDLARLLRDAGQPVGYCLVERATGRIGPLAAPTIDGFLALLDDMLAAEPLRSGTHEYVSLRIVDPDRPILDALAARNLHPVPRLLNVRMEKVYRRPVRRRQGYYASARPEKG